MPWLKLEPALSYLIVVFLIFLFKKKCFHLYDFNLTEEHSQETTLGDIPVEMNCPVAYISRLWCHM